MDLSDPLVGPIGPLVITGHSALVALLALLFFLLAGRFAARARAGYRIALRPLHAFQLLKQQIGEAIETGRQIHVGLGRAGLTGERSMTSLSGLAVLDSLAEDSCANDTPPVATSGSGTLHAASQDSLYRGYTAAGRLRDYRLGTTLLLAPDAQPLVYAAGAADLVVSGGVSSNLLVGHFGSEIALITEAANRQRTTQIVGSDDLTALAIGATATEHLLIGEEFLAAHAHLGHDERREAALRAQDVLRYLIAALVLAAAVAGLVLGGL